MGTGNITSPIAAGAESGRWLIAAKARLISEVGHGHWGRWRRDNCRRIEERMAQMYMAAARFPQCVADSTTWDEFRERVTEEKAKTRPQPEPTPGEMPDEEFIKSLPISEMTKLFNVSEEKRPEVIAALRDKAKPEPKTPTKAAKKTKARAKTYRRNRAIKPAGSPSTDAASTNTNKGSKNFRVCVVDQVMIWYPVKATTKEEAMDKALDWYGRMLGTADWGKLIKSDDDFEPYCDAELVKTDD